MPHDRATILVNQYQKAAITQAGENSYKGLHVHALPGLHDFIASVSIKYFKAGDAVLDLAAGSGAMSLRLSDIGFHVTATDYVQENFKLKSVPFTQADLNEHFSAAYTKRFQAIVASEIIEHLENPRHFARECFKLLEPGGRMVVSTPNVESAASLALFIRSGAFAWFSDDDYQNDGHITPLTHSQLYKAFSEVGFKFLWKGSFGEGIKKIKGSPRLGLLARFISFISPRDALLGGEIFVFVVERPSS